MPLLGKPCAKGRLNHLPHVERQTGLLIPPPQTSQEETHLRNVNPCQGSSRGFRRGRPIERPTNIWGKTPEQGRRTFTRTQLHGRWLVSFSFQKNAKAAQTTSADSHSATTSTKPSKARNDKISQSKTHSGRKIFCTCLSQAPALHKKTNIEQLHLKGRVKSRQPKTPEVQHAIHERPTVGHTHCPACQSEPTKHTPTVVETTRMSCGQNPFALAENAGKVASMVSFQGN